MAADENCSGRKSFTYIWKIENANYCMLDEQHRSPSFTVDELYETKWELQLTFFSEQDYASVLRLQRLNNYYEGEVVIDCEFACLSSDGSVLYSLKRENNVLGKYDCIEDYDFVEWNKILYKERSRFLSHDALLVRCRIWKSVGKMHKNEVWFSCTHIVVEKRAFRWDIENFSSIAWCYKKSFEITSLQTGDQLMLLEFSLIGEQIFVQAPNLKIIPNYENVNKSTFKLSVIDSSNNIIKCSQCEFWRRIHTGTKDIKIFRSKKELLNKNKELLPNDVLSLLCEFSFSSGAQVDEFQSIISNCSGIENLEPIYRTLGNLSGLHVPKGVLINDFKSLMNNSMFSDVKLKTINKTYFAHKNILSSRSSVFKAMFSNDMKENSKDYADIGDISDETVLHMLQYIYCGDVEELEWNRATELYEVADKYAILDLKDTCSSYLKSNLCPSNACEALELADLHQDVDLKGLVQDFILNHGESVINSSEWDRLMETNLQLAAETMCRKYKKSPT